MRTSTKLEYVKIKNVYCVEYVMSRQRHTYFFSFQFNIFDPAMPLKFGLPKSVFRASGRLEQVINY